MNNYTIGSDPEMVIMQDGVAKCAIPILDYRDKHNRIDLGNGSSIYYDNALSEGTIKPADSPEGLVESFRHLFGQSNLFLKDRKAEIVSLASVDFTSEELKKYPAALEFGCNPEADMWEVCMCPPPFCDPASGFRSAGGHIHIGRKDYKESDDDAFLMNIESKINVIRAMDVIVGTALTAMENDPSAPARKKLYGMAGRARYELPYGVEYRTPANGWTAHPEKVKLVFKLSMLALDFALENQEMLDNKAGLPYDAIIKCINSGDSKMAMSLINELPNKGFKNEIVALANLPFNPFVAQNYNL
jgi:hypothetical protein